VSALLWGVQARPRANLCPAILARARYVVGVSEAARGRSHIFKEGGPDKKRDNTTGSYLVVEAEEVVALDNLTGVLQAMNYKYMLAVKCHRYNPMSEEVRAFLVAHEIDG